VAKHYQVVELHNILSASRYPVSTETLMQIMACSNSTIGRILRDMKNSYDAPIEFDRIKNGYYYNTNSGEIFELPGLWFNESELHALLVAQQLLIDVQPGLFKAHLDPLLSKINKILENSHKHPEKIAHKVNILHQAHRPTNEKIFQQLATGLLDGKQISIVFYNRAKDQTDSRNISPLKLVYYRDNWYLDAWCHKAEGFRQFSVTNIKRAVLLKTPSRTFSDKQLEDHFASAYGIFSGKANKIAVLQFNEYRARWVSDENWHPQQASKWLTNGDYELRIPYRHHQELIMDILKYGSDVTVTSPPALVTLVREEILKNIRNYECSVTF